MPSKEIMIMCGYGGGGGGGWREKKRKEEKELEGGRERE